MYNAGIAGTSCTQAAIEAMNTHIDNITLVDQTFCRYEPNTDEYENDPCCNSFLLVCDLSPFFLF